MLLKKGNLFYEGGIIKLYTPCEEDIIAGTGFDQERYQSGYLRQRPDTSQVIRGANAEWALLQEVMQSSLSRTEHDEPRLEPVLERDTRVPARSLRAPRSRDTRGSACARRPVSTCDCG